MHIKTFLFLSLLCKQQFCSKNYAIIILGLNRFLTKNMVDLLNKRGILIKTRNLSYSYTKYFYKLCTERIREYTELSSRSQISLIESFDNIDSTNNYIKKRLIEKSLRTKKIFLCFSEQQEKGRGRRHKKWISPYAKNIYQSLCFCSYLTENTINLLSLNIALALIKALDHYGLENKLNIKLPNDIFWDKKKIAGILIEIVKLRGGKIFTVIGTGINIRAPEDTQSKYRAIGLQEINRKEPRKNYLCATVLKYFFNSLKSLIHCN